MAGIEGFRLSLQQQRLWSQCAAAGLPIAHCRLALQGPLDVRLLRDSLRSVVQRQEILRTLFKTLPEATLPLQVVSDLEPRWLPRLDLTGLTEQELERELSSHARSLGRDELDLARGPVLAARLVRRADDDHALLLAASALSCDAQTFENLAASLCSAYAAGGTLEEDEELLQYVDFSEWQHGMLAEEESEEGKGYWRLRKPPSADGLTSVRGQARKPAASLPRRLEGERWQRLKALSESHDASGEALMLAAWLSLLQSRIGRSRITTTLCADGRPFEELRLSTGLFAFDLPFSFSPDRSCDRPTMAQRLGLELEEAIGLQEFFSWDLWTSQKGDQQTASPRIPFAFEYRKEAQLHAGGGLRIRVEAFEVPREECQARLLCRPQGASLEFIVGSQGGLDQTRVEELAQGLDALLESLAGHPRQAISELRSIGEREAARLAALGSMQGRYPLDRCFHQLFRERAEATPQAPAAAYEGSTLSYRELDQRSDRLANLLQSLGIGPERVVALCLERSLEMSVALLGTLKAGGAFLPLDPDAPGERLMLMLGESGAEVMLTQTSLRRKLQDCCRTVVCLDDEHSMAAADERPLPSRTAEPHPANTAYVIYTSGSTGRPKGVVIEHRQLLNYAFSAAERMQLEEGASSANLSALSADLGNTAIFPVWLRGGCVHFIGQDRLTDAARLAEYMRRCPIDLLKIVPSHLQALLDQGEPKDVLPRQLLVTGGETLSWQLASQVQRLSPQCLILNHYGPSEATVGVSACRVSEIDREAHAPGPPIGRPMGNSSVHLLDEGLRTAPFGVRGELYLAGANLGRGYLHQPARTAERFLPNPFSPTPGSRMYRSGDWAAWNDQGNLEFRGRTDRQIKLRGFRIELGEVEACLLRHPDVKQCAVEDRTSESGQRRLVAYLSCDAGERIESRLEAHLAAWLPEHMHPAVFEILPQLPLTPNGKIDRSALPDPKPSSKKGPESQPSAPQSQAEQLLAGIWRRLLQVDSVAAQDDFFKLGGHSLSATQVVWRIQELLGVEVPLRAIFDHPTLRGLARHVEEASRGQASAAAIPKASRWASGEAPLSFAQQRLWFLHRMHPHSPAYNVPRALIIQGELSAPALEWAFQALEARHDSLRTAFRLRDGEPVQVRREFRPRRLPLCDLAGLDERCRERELRRLKIEACDRPFDLQRDHLLRTLLVCLGPDSHALLLCMHHIVSDAWSMEVLAREAAAFYQAALAGEQPQPPRLELQYADFAVWQRSDLQGEKLQSLLAYWRGRLKGAAILDLPSDRPRPALMSDRGSRLAFAIPAETGLALRRLGDEAGATPFMTMLAAFKTLLHRYANQDDVTVGTVIANRSRAEFKDLIGFFVNTLALRSDLSDNPAFFDLAQRVRANALEAYSHQDMPFELLVDSIGVPRDPSRPPLFQTLFTCEAIDEAPLDFAGLQASPLDLEFDWAKFDLAMAVNLASDGGMTCGLDYSAELFERETIERMAGHFQRLLEGIAENPRCRLRELPILPDRERQRMLLDWNLTQAEFPHECIHSQIEKQAEQRPSALAVVADQESLTFSQLNEQANQLAHLLIGRGAGPESRIGVCLQPGPDLAASLLAVLKTGAAYVPLDPSYPADRLRFMLEDSGALGLISDSASLQRLGPDAPGELALDVESADISRFSRENPGIRLEACNLAYVIYTSGSTGRPKGVAVQHLSLSNLCAWHRKAFHVGSGDRGSQIASLAFDAAVWEIWPYLTGGASLRFLPPSVSLCADRLAESLSAGDLTHCFLATPIAEQVLAEADLKKASIQALLTGGDRLTRRPAAGLPFRLVNNYGPTEATVVSTFAEVVDDEAAKGPPCIGRPIDNCRIYLLDCDQQPAPLGAAGEVCIGGEGLARGYWGSPGLTAQRFRPDPYSPKAGSRFYRSGDLARQRSDGALDFLDRIDQQVKVRGVRIELAEIESVLARHPEVAQCVVTAGGNGLNRRLTAYLVASSAMPDRREAAARLRRFLAEKLPELMLPSAIVVLDRMPLTASGKVDRAALPQPSAEQASMQRIQGPRNATEELLADIWRETLNLPQVDLGDDFFALGGHSLLATQVTSRIRSVLGVDLALREFFQFPTVEKLALRLDELRRDGRQAREPALEASPRNGPIPLSFAQQRLWFLDRMTPDNPFYNCPSVLSLEGELGIEALRMTFEEVERRHEVLRTAFDDPTGEAQQLIRPPSRRELPVVDLEGLGASAARDEAERLSQKEALRPFDLQKGRLMRTALLRLAPKKHLLLATFHHIVADGWSMGVFARESAALYGAFSQGHCSPLPELPLQYADFAVWQRRRLKDEGLREQVAFWRRRLQDVPPLELPADRPRPSVQSFRGGHQELKLPAELLRLLRTVARRQGATLYMVLLAAYQAFLHRLSRQTDFCVGTGIANRHRREIEGMIGFFVNTLAIRADLSGAPTFAQLLQRLRATLLDAYDRQDLPFEKLIDDLSVERDLSRMPLVQAMFVLQNAPMGNTRLPGLTISQLEVEPGTSKFDLSFFAKEVEDGLQLFLEFNADIFEERSGRRMLQQIGTMLQGVAADAQCPIKLLPLLSQSERQELLRAGRGAEASKNDGIPLQTRIERRVRQDPAAIAAIFLGQSLTYRELNARANRIARYLRSLGVDRGSLVGLLLNPSLDRAAALLGIFKSGAAFVPLDPEYPVRRLADMLEQSRPAAVLTSSSLARRLPRIEDGRIVSLDEAGAEIERLPDSDLAARASGEDLAYVIFTSGSTGRPKGVMIARQGLDNLVRFQLKALDIHPRSRVLQFASISFDASVWETFATWAGGAALIIGDGRRADLASLIAFQGVSLATLTPSLLAALGDSSFPSLETLVSAGEACLPQTARNWTAKTRFINAYGPTETTVCASFHPCRSAPGASVPIGGPIDGLRLYILDAEGQLTPTGVPGELCIAGSGLARGYLGQPSLSAERFAPDPLAGIPGQRIYRSGDLARWRSDATVEFLGRIDHQIKLRGHRIELGEIESQLALHPAVRECVAMAGTEAGSQGSLVAYAVRGQSGEAATDIDRQVIQAERVQDWKSLYQDVYARSQDAPGDFNIAGWNSSFTGEPLPAQEMRAWIESAVEEILSLNPKSILEIGCGSGLLLQRLAPRCRRYVGTDFSQPALDFLQRQIGEDPAFSHVELARRDADSLRGIEKGSFDVIVLNSVVQYFPSLGYLKEVIEAAAQLLAWPGALYVGDVRSLPLLEAFHVSVQTFKAEPSANRMDIAARARRSLANEEELAIAPWYWLELARGIPGLSRVEARPKPGGYENELNRFRYTAVLHFAPMDEAAPPVSRVDWEPGMDLASLRRLLTQSPSQRLVVEGIPNRRLLEANAQRDWLRGKGHPDCAGDLRRSMERFSQLEAFEPDDVKSLQEGLPGRVDLNWASSRSDGTFDLLYSPTGARWRIQELPQPAWSSPEGGANDPLRGRVAQRLVPQLRDWLEDRLPQHMIPADILLLDSFPLTASGKVDRKALPAPGEELRRPSRSFVPPRSEAEERLAGIWSEVLLLDRIGVNDNFFDLGGDSILAIQVVNRARRKGLEIAPRLIFEHQTIAALAAAASLREDFSTVGEEVSGEVPMTPIQRWFFEQDPAGAHRHHWNQAFLLVPSPSLRPEQLRIVLSALVDRHDALRMRFRREEGGWKQSCSPPQASVPFGHVDLSGLPEEWRPPEMKRCCNQLQTSLCLEQGPILRSAWFECGAEMGRRLALVIHHLAVDGVSWRILLEDLQQASLQLLRGEELQLGIRTTTTQQWGRSLLRSAAEDDWDEEIEYWKSLSAKPKSRPPVDFSQPDSRRVRGIGSVRTRLDAERTQVLLRRTEGALGAGVQDVLLTALSYGICSWTGRDSLWIHIDRHGREPLEPGLDVSRTVGWFTSLFPMRLEFDPEAAVETAVESVRRQMAQLPGNGFSYGLLRYLSPRQDVRSLMAAIPEAQVLFNYHGQFDQTLGREGLLSLAAEEPGEAVHPASQRPYLLALTAVVESGCLHNAWSFDASALREETAAAVAQASLRYLEEILDRCLSPLAD